LVFCCQGFEARGTTISGRLNAYDHLLEETIADPSKVHLNDLTPVRYFLQQNTTLLNAAGAERNETTDDDVLEHEMPSEMDSYFCDIPSLFQCLVTFYYY